MILNIDGVKVACGLDWLKTTFGMVALGVSLVLALVGAWFADWFDKKEEARRYPSWHDFPLPKNLTVEDRGKTQTGRFWIMSDTNVPGFRTIIARLPFRPHAEMFIQGIELLRRMKCRKK